MPIINTLGALTTLKVDDPLYWIASFFDAFVPPIMTTFVESNNSISLSGRTITTPAGQPMYIKVSPGSGTLPTILYSAYYGTNANTEGRFVSSLYDSVNNRTILVGQQESNISGNILDCGLIRVFNSDNTSFAAFIDPPTPATSTNDRTLSSVILNANSTITAAGTLSRDPTFPSYFLTNYSQTGSRNWSKTITNTAGLPIIHHNIGNTILISCSDANAQNTVFGYVQSNGASIVNQFALQNTSASLSGIVVDANDDLYISASKKLIKYDSSANSISWTKEVVGNNIFGTTAIYNGNIYATINDTDSPPQAISAKIVSINANTGTVNWKNDFSITSTNGYFALTDISANGAGIFALGQFSDDISTGGILGSSLFTMPLSGNIPGTGSYDITGLGTNLSITTSSVIINNSSANIVSSNIGLANANVVSTIASSISANTTQNYTFNEIVLK